MMYTTLACVVILAVLTIVLLVRRQFPGLRSPNLPPGMSNIINGKDARLTIFYRPSMSSYYWKPASNAQDWGPS